MRGERWCEESVENVSVESGEGKQEHNNFVHETLKIAPRTKRHSHWRS